MKKRGLAFILSAAMLLTATPVNALVSLADETAAEETVILEENTEADVSEGENLFLQESLEESFPELDSQSVDEGLPVDIASGELIVEGIEEVGEISAEEAAELAEDEDEGLDYDSLYKQNTIQKVGIGTAIPLGELKPGRNYFSLNFSTDCFLKLETTVDVSSCKLYYYDTGEKDYWNSYRESKDAYGRSCYKVYGVIKHLLVVDVEGTSNSMLSAYTSDISPISEFGADYGKSATLSAPVGEYTYQWYNKDGTIIPNATEATYITPAVTQDTAYYCIVDDGFLAVEVYCWVWVKSEAAGTKPSDTKPSDNPDPIPLDNPSPIPCTHNYVGKITTEPTVLATGIKTYTCSVCGDTKTETIAKLESTISVNVSSIPLKVKQSTTKVKVTMGEGDYVVSWKSDKPKVAKVNAEGKITGVKKGTAKITVTLASGKAKTITVKVQNGKVKTTKITNVPEKVTLKKGSTYTLEPTIAPITTTEKAKYSSANKKIATVSKKGVITARKKGKVKITVKCGSKKKNITVTVK